MTKYVDIECSFDADSGLLSRFPARHYYRDFWNGFVDCYVTLPTYLALVHDGMLEGCEPEDYEEMANNVAYAIRERDGWVSLNGLCVFFADEDAERCSRDEYDAWDWKTGSDACSGGDLVT